MNHPQTLRNENVKFRLINEKDINRLFTLIDRNRDFFHPWYSWVNKSTTIDDIQKRVDDYLEKFHKNQALEYGIWIDNQLIGVVAFSYINKVNRSANIGYYLDQDYQRKGIMTKACQMLIDYGFNTLHLHRIELICGTGNTKSCALAERLGFEKEGVLKQSEWIHDRYIDKNIYGLITDR